MAYNIHSKNRIFDLFCAVACGAMLATLQLGVSYYLSVAVFAFASLAVWSVFAINRDIALCALIAFTTFFIKSLSIAGVQGINREVLLPFREFACFFVLLLLSRRLSMQNIADNKIIRFVVAALIVLVAVLGAQVLLIRKGVNCTIPIKYFITNQGTLEGVELALKHGTRLRPPAFYGEPSYAAFIIIALMFTGISRAKTGRQVSSIMLLAFFGLCLTQSLAGVLAFILLTATLLIERSQVKSVVALLVVIAVSAIVALNVPEFQERLKNLRSGDDTSTEVRMLMPLRILASMTPDEAVVGLTKRDIFSRSGGRGIDNGIYNFIITYGVVSSLTVIALVLYFRRNVKMLVFIAICASFNGMIFGYDKAVVVGSSIGLSLRPNQLLRKNVGNGFRNQL